LPRGVLTLAAISWEREPPRLKAVASKRDVFSWRVATSVSLHGTSPWHLNVSGSQITLGTVFLFLLAFDLLEIIGGLLCKGVVGFLRQFLEELARLLVITLAELHFTKCE